MEIKMLPTEGDTITKVLSSTLYRTCEYVSDKNKNNMSIQIHTISKIQDVYVDKDGFLVATIPNTHVEFVNVQDGWPIYMGYEEWAFLVKKDLPIQASKSISAYITIKSKQPIHVGQNFALLNRQDDLGHTNEEIIEAVDTYSRMISWSDDVRSDLDKYNWDVICSPTSTTMGHAINKTYSPYSSSTYNTSTSGLTYSNDTTSTGTIEFKFNQGWTSGTDVFDKISVDPEERRVCYKGSELINTEGVDARMQSVLHITEDLSYNMDIINSKLCALENAVDTYKYVIENNTKDIDELTKVIDNHG